MSKALYRVLRPTRWSEVVDKDLIVEVLKNQVKKNQTSHGYLFCGMRGTGKTTCAKILARAVNCLNPQDGEPCNECENCKMILSDRAVDVLEIDAASNNGVDNIRNLKELGVYPPTLLKKKVYIIDEAHMLSNSAFNALLKILEEPPSHLIFILATTEPDKLPDTVKSRLQRFDFHGISKEVLKKQLEKTVKDLNEDVDDSVYSMIAENARGSMRDALSMLDQLLSIPKRPITTNIVTNLLGITGTREIYPLLKAIIEMDSILILKESRVLLNHGKSPEKLLYALMNSLRDLFILKLDDKRLTVDIADESLIKLKDYINEDRILFLMEAFRKLINEINFAFDESSIFQAGVLEAALKGKIASKSTFVSGPIEIKEVKKELVTKPQYTQEDENLDTLSKKDGSKDSFALNTEDLINKSEDLNEASKKDDLENKDKSVEESFMVDSNIKEDSKSSCNDEKIDDNEGEEILENPEGERILNLTIDKNPMVVTIPIDYYAKFKDNILTLTPKHENTNDTVLKNYKEEIIKVLKNEYGEDVKLEITKTDPIIKKAIEFFGDKLNIIN